MFRLAQKYLEEKFFSLLRQLLVKGDDVEEFRREMNVLFRRPMILFQIYSIIHFIYETFINRQHPIALQILLFFTPLIYIIFYLAFPDSILETKINYYFISNLILHIICNYLFFKAGRFVYISNVFITFMFLCANLMLHPKVSFYMGIILLFFNGFLYIFLQDVYLLNQLLIISLFGLAGPLTGLKMVYPYLKERELEFEKKINRFQFYQLLSKQNSIFILEDLVSNLVHDTNNSITGILNYSDFIVDEIESLPEEMKRKMATYAENLIKESNKIQTKLKLLSQLGHTELKYENLVNLNLLIEHCQTLSATGLRKSNIEVNYIKDFNKDIVLKFDFRILLIIIAKCLILLKNCIVFKEVDKNFKRKIEIHIQHQEFSDEIVIQIKINGGILDATIGKILNKEIGVSEIFNNPALRDNKNAILAISLIDSIDTHPIYLTLKLDDGVENEFEIRMINQKIFFK